MKKIHNGIQSDVLFVAIRRHKCIKAFGPFSATGENYMLLFLSLPHIWCSCEFVIYVYQFDNDRVDRQIGGSHVCPECNCYDCVY